MKTLIIVSKCVRVTNFDQSENWYQFHFKGVCSGERLQKVVLKGRKDFGIQKHQEYLMYVQQISFEEGTLVGRILKAKPLDECWDRS